MSHQINLSVSIKKFKIEKIGKEVIARSVNFVLLVIKEKLECFNVNVNISRYQIGKVSHENGVSFCKQFLLYANIKIFYLIKN